jgi:G protein-coupled receptor 64/G protein-coupled receptor 126
MLPSANCTNSTAITLEGGAYSLIGSNIVFWISYNLNVSIESVNTNGRPIVCIPSVESSTCVPIILSSSEYGQRDNISGTLVVVPSNVSYMIEGYDAQGRPLICTNFTQTRNRTTTSNLFAYPIAFDILTYIGFCIDFASASLFLLTFILFKELRTFFSKLMVNFMVSIILGDTVFLIGGPLFALLNLPPLCTTVAILLHYAFLCRFSWMTVMGSELVRSFYNIKKLNKGAAENWKLLSLYMLVGWLSPLVIVIPTIIVNFTVDNSVNYGVGNSCWINGAIALIVTFVVPVGVSIVLNTITFIIVMVMLIRIRNRPMVASSDPSERKKQSLKDLRFAVTLLVLTGLSWLFGFLALLSRDLSWAWYLFIIFNTTQALAVLMSLFFTKKVFRLYHSLLSCSGKQESKGTISSKKHTAESSVSLVKIQHKET